MDVCNTRGITDLVWNWEYKATVGFYSLFVHVGILCLDHAATNLLFSYGAVVNMRTSHAQECYEIRLPFVLVACTVAQCKVLCTQFYAVYTFIICVWHSLFHCIG